MISRYVEIAALAVIAVLIAAGGRSILSGFGSHRVLAAFVIVGLIVLALAGLRRTFRAAAGDARLVITKNVAYLAVAGLVLTDMLAPAKWLPGSCIAAAEVALVFDIMTIVTRRRVAEGA
jgi:hypothetical protein